MLRDMLVWSFVTMSLLWGALELGEMVDQGLSFATDPAVHHA
jgi:hypothetical protein